MKPSIVFFGNEHLATGLKDVESKALIRLLDEGYDVKAVVVRQKTGRYPASRTTEMIASSHEIPLFRPESSEEAASLPLPEADAGVLIAFGLIVPQSLIDHFPRGIINLHPSLLPAYRGSTPIEQVILDGAHRSGVSIMQLSAQMDAGPVFCQEAIDLTMHETKIELAEKLHDLGANMLAEAMPHIIEGSLPAKAQDESQATFCSQIQKPDGEIDWTKPAYRLEREIRAYLGWPSSRTQLLGRDVAITAARVAPGEGKPGETVAGGKNTEYPLFVYCGQELLVIDRLKPDGKREMSSAEFVRGLRLP